MLGVFLLPAFTHLGHEYQHLLSPCDGNARVHRLDLSLYSHSTEFWVNGVRTHVNSKGKIPSTGKILPRGGWNPRRWNQAGQRAQHTTNELFLPPPSPPPPPSPHTPRFQNSVCEDRIDTPGASIMEADDHQVTTVFTVQASFHHRQTEYHETLPYSTNDEVRCDCTFADDSNAS